MTVKMLSVKKIAAQRTIGSDDLYAHIATAKPAGCLLLVDSFKSVASLMETKQVDILKLAKYELGKLLDEEIQFPSSGLLFFKKYPSVKWLAVTDGPNSAFLFNKTQFWKYTIPKIPADALVNPIGAGDTCGGVMLAKHIIVGVPMKEAFQWGLAAATAKCYLQGGGGVYSEAQCDRCYHQISVSEHVI